ncbi:MAG: addiction module protein [Candidatus Thioglobus sp.]|nr:addiction module protein [Candidatus Thioglobus sp.]
MNLEQIETEALHLPIAQRAKLSHKLLLSIDDNAGELEQVWMNEAQQRAQDLDGEIAGISADVVRAKARKLVK